MSESPSIIPISVTDVSGSYGTATWAESTNRFLGECVKCARPVAVRHTSTGQHVKLTCPACGESVMFERLYAVKSNTSCDYSCMYAFGPSCTCGCGGGNHGRGWESTVITGHVVESALAKYRDIQLKKQQRKERERARQESAFAVWVQDYTDLVEALDELWTWDATLERFRNLIRRGTILTEAQLEYAADLIPQAIEARHKREQQLAAFEEQRYLAAPGTHVTVTGIIRKLRSFDKGFGRPSRVIVVECIGENRGVTVKGFSSARKMWEVEEGQRVTISGVVKSHEEYEFVKETRLTNLHVEG